MAPMRHEEVLSFRGLSKSFGRARALRGVDLTIRRGEFVGLMGPNGAGKSTLIKILDGIYTPDTGEIRLNGERVTSLRGRAEAGFVHQDLALVDGLSIAENLRLGQDPILRLGFLLDHRAERESALAALRRVGLGRDPQTFVADLSPGERALVAVARALDRGAQIVVVDEATSTLAPSDSKRLISALRQVVAQGSTVIMVSHKLSEILGAADRIVVIVDGVVSVDRPRGGLDHEAVLRLLYHEEIEQAAAHDVPLGDVLLSAGAASGDSCGPIDLDVRAGEVIGLTGLPGSGLHDVALMLAGKSGLRAGTVHVADGVLRALVPPHRESQGGFLDLDVLTNMTISSLSTWRRAWGLVSQKAEQAAGDEMVRRLEVTPRDSAARFEALSGGNKQKVIFGRAMLRGARVYVLCEPTRGVDVQTRAQLYRLIRRFAADGAGVLIFSSDAEDLFAVCDRVGLIEQGRISGLRVRTELTTEMIEELV